MINGRYNVVKELGRGGMGQVFLVEDTHRNDTKLALKTLLPNRIEKDYLKDFVIEFGELAKLEHPHVARAYDFGKIQETNEYFFTTEFIRGVDLFKGTQGLNDDQLINVTVQLLHGLNFIHTHGLLHNDLKPVNVLLGEHDHESSDTAGRGNLAKLEAAVYGVAGCVKLIDFGLLSGEGVAWSNIRGTPRYIAPERILCKPTDRRGDLYSLGCMLYVLFTRKHAFQGRSSKELMAQHMSEARVPIRQLRHDVPKAIELLVERLIVKNPDERIESASAALEFLGESASVAKAPTGKKSKTPDLVAGALLHRDEELKTLLDLFKDTAKGQKHDATILVDGADGLGKSRLLEELRTNVQIRGGGFVDVQADSHRFPDAVIDAVLADMRRTGVDGLKEAESLVAEVRGGSKAMDVACLFEKIVFAYAENAPVVLHFDDLERATRTVHRLAVELMHSSFSEIQEGNLTSRLLIVASLATGTKQLKLRVPGARVLTLSAFDKAESHEYVRRVFGQDDIPEEVLDELTRIARGNPGHLLELVRSLAGSGNAQFDGMRWEFPEHLIGVELPGSLGDSILQRVKTLGSQAKEILHWLAVCRLPSCADFLAANTLFPREKAAFVANKLCNDGLISREQTHEAPRYYIGQPHLRTALLEELTESQLSSMHQRLAQNTDDADLDGGEGAKAVEMAHHWLAAGNVPGFLRYAATAAAHLQHNGNLAKAIEYHRVIFENMSDESAGKKIKSLARLAEMNEFLWDLEQSRAQLQSILEIGHDLLRPADRSSLLRRMGCLELSRHHYRRAVELFSEARKCADLSLPLQRASLDAPESWALWMCGARDQARDRLTSATESREELLQQGWPSEPRQVAAIVAASNHLANTLQYLGELQRAEELHRESLEALEKTDMRQALAATHCALGTVLLDRSVPPEAVSHLETAVEIGKEIGDRRTLCRARERLGEYHFLYGDLKQALHIVELGLEDAQSLRHLSATALLLRLLGRIYRHAGQYDDADEVQEKALAIQRDTADIAGTCKTRLDIARRLIAEGRLEAARTHLDMGAMDSEQLDSPLLTGLLWLARIELALAAGQAVEATLTTQTHAALQRAGFAREAADVPLLLCRAELERGDTGAARAALEQFGDKFLTLGATNEQRAEHEFLTAKVEIAEGEVDSGRERLKRLKRWAANNVYPLFVERCEKAMPEHATA